MRKRRREKNELVYSTHYLSSTGSGSILLLHGRQKFLEHFGFLLVAR